MNNINVAILGLGTIGVNVVNILKENYEYIRKTYDVEINISYIYVRNVSKQRNVDLKGINLVNDIAPIINDDSVSIVIECMGGSGTEKTYELLKKIIQNKKNIIMASKKCLALYGDKLIKLLQKNDAQVRFDATVGGGIPIFQVLKGFSGYDKIHKIYGIVNASTNYVLSLVDKEHIEFDVAVKKAQDLGYAENDPSEDINGWDALYKSLILLKYGLRIQFDYKGFELENIYESRKKLSVSEESEVKQIFYAEINDDENIKLYVGLKDVKNTLLSGVDYADNIICTEHKYGGNRAYRGKGAGGKETASVIVEDLLDIIQYNRLIHDEDRKVELIKISEGDVKI